MDPLELALWTGPAYPAGLWSSWSKLRPASRGQRWACHPGDLGVASCFFQSPPRTLSHTQTRPADAQAEILYSPLLRLVEDLRSHRLPSLGSSFLVGRECPRRCPGRSVRAAAGSPPLLKSRCTCGAAPLNPSPAVCWHWLAEVPCPLFGGARAR